MYVTVIYTTLTCHACPSVHRSKRYWVTYLQANLYDSRAINTRTTMVNHLLLFGYKNIKILDFYEMHYLCLT